MPLQSPEAKSKQTAYFLIQCVNRQEETISKHNSEGKQENCSKCSYLLFSIGHITILDLLSCFRHKNDSLENNMVHLAGL